MNTLLQCENWPSSMDHLSLLLVLLTVSGMILYQPGSTAGRNEMGNVLSTFRSRQKSPGTDLVPATNILLPFKEETRAEKACSIVPMSTVVCGAQ